MHQDNDFLDQQRRMRSDTVCAREPRLQMIDDDRDSVIPQIARKKFLLKYILISGK
jgi:hypothetical protein